MVKRTGKQIKVEHKLKSKSKTSYCQWCDLIDYFVKQFNLCHADRQDLRQQLWIYLLIHSTKNIYKDVSIARDLNRFKDSILANRRLHSIGDVPEDELDRYLAVSYAHDYDWQDFNFTMLTADEMKIIEMFFRQEKSLAEIAKELDVKYATVAKRFERGKSRLRANKHLFL
jgi:hypothetical protein